MNPATPYVVAKGTKVPRVLVVDDSKTMRNLISGTLDGSFESLQALDGEDALEKYPVFKPHIIVLDLDMPRMNGLDVIEGIRIGHKDQDTFIIVLSGHEENELKAEALNRGANDYLTKPFHPAELKARVGVAGRQVFLNLELRRAYARISAEIALVASLQNQLLPRQDMLVQGLEIKSLYHPSGQASGDYYDYFPMQDGRIRLVLADIAGKGAHAAFLMAILHAFFHLGRNENHSLEKTLTLINNHLMEICPAGSGFATLFAADLDLDSKTLSYINAGHCPALMLNFAGESTKLEAQTYPLGVLDIHFIAETISFNLGSRLFLYTDGMFEWELDQSKMLSLDDFLEQAEIAASCEEPFLEALPKRLALLASSPPRYMDDQAALWVRWTGESRT
jgi:sigma-B regulation protein RsbU (phosphoserine phosphatase)